MNTSITSPSLAHFRQQAPTNPNYIVVEDPDGEYWEGAVIPAGKAKMLEARGVIALPYEPSLAHIGNGGFMKRSFGGGFPLESRTPRMNAPLTLWLNKSFPWLTWCARLMPDDSIIERVRAGEKLEGILRFSADSQMPTAHVATLSSKQHPLTIKQLGALDDLDGWIIGGSAKVNLSQENHYGFGLYGMAPGVRVIWLAAATAANE